MQNNRSAFLMRAKEPTYEFGVAFISVMIAVLLRLPLSPTLGSQNAFITFFPAVVVGAWIGGWRGGMSATVMSALAAVYFLIPPKHSLLITHSADQLSLFIFVVVGACLSALGNLQREREYQLAKSEARYRLLLDTVNEGAVRTNPEDRVIFINSRMSQMLGYSPDELLGSPFDTLLFAEDVEFAREKRSAQQGVAAQPFELRLRHKNGSSVWSLVSLTVVDDSREPGETFGLFTDITERRRAQERLDAAFRRETQINQIGQAIRDTADPGEIQNAAVRALGAALNVDRVYYNAFDLAHDLGWIGKDFFRSDLPSLEGKFKISSFGIDPMAYYPEGKTLILPDLFAEEWSPPLFDALRSLRVRSAVSVPLFDDGLLVGTLAVAMADEPREWTPDEVSLVEAIAVQTRSALDVSRIHQREHRIASALQGALLPDVPGQVQCLQLAPYMKPALDEAEIGGDFYDVFPLDERYVALIIGDVSGKGLAAAAQLALIRNSLRTTLYLYKAPGIATSRLNDILNEHDLLVGFVTAFVSVYDSQTGRVMYVSCGHEPGFVRRAAGGNVEVLETTSPPLGATENGLFIESVTVLSEGDVLFLYTDGLSEAGPDRKRLLGTDGLRAIFDRQGAEPDLNAMASQIIVATSAYADGNFRDDVCLLLARYIPTPKGD